MCQQNQKTYFYWSHTRVQISLKTKAMFCHFHEHVPAFELFPSRNLLEHRVRVWSLDRALDRWVDQAYRSPITRENTRRLDPKMFPTVAMTALGLYTLIRSSLTCHHSTVSCGTQLLHSVPFYAVDHCIIFKRLWSDVYIVYCCSTCTHTGTVWTIRANALR